MNVPVTITAASAGKFTVDLPTWAPQLELVLLGGGGGGQGGAIAGVGNGGYGGKWRGYTVNVDDWLAGKDVHSIKAEITVGAGGAGGTAAALVGKGGKPGADTTVLLWADTTEGGVTYTTQALSAPGGKDTTGTTGNVPTTGSLIGIMNGRPATGGNLSGGRDIEYGNAVYLGGKESVPGTAASKPGGGGSGGNIGMGNGVDGAPGAAFVRAYVPPTHRRIAVWECVGTGDPRDATPIKQGIDPHHFIHTTVKGYPNNIALAVSVPQGVQRVVENITANPGRFVLVGTSQGAGIMSEVVKLLVSGTLPRLDDCLGAFMIGNPERETGTSFPGSGATAPGHGIVADWRRLRNTPEFLWEFAKPGDPICCNGDTIQDQALTAWFELLMGVTNTLVPLDVGVQAAANLISGMTAHHNEYETWKPIPGDPRTVPQIICDRLNHDLGPAHRFDYPLPEGDSRDGPAEVPYVDITLYPSASRHHRH